MDRGPRQSNAYLSNLIVPWIRNFLPRLTAAKRAPNIRLASSFASPSAVVPVNVTLGEATQLCMFVRLRPSAKRRLISSCLSTVNTHRAIQLSRHDGTELRCEQADARLFG
jgi:hypothetical protein